MLVLELRRGDRLLMLGPRDPEGPIPAIVLENRRYTRQRFSVHNAVVRVLKREATIDHPPENC